jgi:glucose-1-phosphate thymidylyltransferase
MPVYDKPMIYYPLGTLMQAGITDILIISTPQDTGLFRELLGSGDAWGLRLSYAIQPNPNGLAQAFTIGESFIGKDDVALVLGDNLFYGHELTTSLQKVARTQSGATVFAYHVREAKAYGVVEFDENRAVLSIEEKPESPKSNYALPGIYFFDNRVVGFAHEVTPSARGELEIVDVIKRYLSLGELSVEIMGRGTAWLDTGTLEALVDAALFVQTIEKRQGLKINCPEEIAYRMGLIDETQLRCLAEKLGKSGYGEYLLNLLQRDAY